MSSQHNASAVETEIIGIQGMTCDNCVRRVEKALRAQPGVSLVLVDKAAQKATITFDSKQTTVVALSDAIRKSGYQTV